MGDLEIWEIAESNCTGEKEKKSRKMKKKLKQWIRMAGIVLVFGLCSCGNQQGSSQETDKEIYTQENGSLADTESIANQDTQIKQIKQTKQTKQTEDATEDKEEKKGLTNQIKNRAEESAKETKSIAEETETLSPVEEKWNSYWADGEFTYEEVKLILEEAGYQEKEGLYEDPYGHIVEPGIAWDLIGVGYVLHQLENGSYELVSVLEAKYSGFNLDEIDAIISSHGYEIEYNNDIPLVYDGKGNSYSYDELASRLLEGEDIPDAPQSQVNAVNSYVELLEGEWVSEYGSEITIEVQNGKVSLQCCNNRADGRKILETYAQIQIHADGSFIGYYDLDSWENQGTVYGEYHDESGQMHLVITVDVDSGMGYSCEMDQMCVRKYSVPFEDFVSLAAEAFEEGYTWCNDNGNFINIWGNGTYYYIDIYYYENGTIQPYEYDKRLYQDENGVYFEIEDKYCYGKVYLYFCADDIEHVWIFTKMEILVSDFEGYLHSDYQPFFDRKLYAIQ